MKIALARAEKDGEHATGPIIYVCPSGTHRCGTMAALDIILDRITAERKVALVPLEETEQVGVIETLEVLRSQRYGCVSHYEHYQHIVDVVVRHAVSSWVVAADAIAD